MFDRVFIDDVDVTGKLGGDAYARFGIEPSGAIVIVRPDGYVGMVAPFHKVDDLNTYFYSFLTPP
jgi:phenol 2-monooxygenase